MPRTDGGQPPQREASTPRAEAQTEAPRTSEAPRAQEAHPDDAPQMRVDRDAIPAQIKALKNSIAKDEAAKKNPESLTPKKLANLNDRLAQDKRQLERLEAKHEDMTESLGPDRLGDQAEDSLALRQSYRP